MILNDIATNMEAVSDSLRGVDHRLSQYDHLQSSLHSTNVASDSFYQRQFGNYYVVRARNDEWRGVFYSILEREKNNLAVKFSEVLTEMFDKTKRVELSFISKLFATINPDRPVYDSNVRTCLKLTAPRSHWSAEKKLQYGIDLYERLTNLVDALTGHTDFEALRDSFDQQFPEFRHFTDVKKLDLFLWRYGDILKGGNLR